MLRPILIALIVASSFAGTPASAGRNTAGNSETIPPNCLLNPFTHKLECVTWPTQPPKK